MFCSVCCLLVLLFVFKLGQLDGEFKINWTICPFLKSHQVWRFINQKTCKWHSLCCILNTLKPRQNCRHFGDDIYKCIFFHENVWISFNMSHNFVLKFRINNIPVLVQAMTWCRSGDKQLPEPMVSFYWRICASLGLNGLKALTQFSTNILASGPEYVRFQFNSVAVIFFTAVRLFFFMLVTGEEF